MRHFHLRSHASEPTCRIFSHSMILAGCRSQELRRNLVRVASFVPSKGDVPPVPNLFPACPTRSRTLTIWVRVGCFCNQELPTFLLKLGRRIRRGDTDQRAENFPTVPDPLVAKFLDGRHCSRSARLPTPNSATNPAFAVSCQSGHSLFLLAWNNAHGNERGPAWNRVLDCCGKQ